MYDNIGGKIKGLAIANCFVEAIAAVIVGIVLLVETEAWWCALILFCGPIVALVSSWLLYGFGEIIDKLCDIEQNTREIKIKKTEGRAEKEAAEKSKQESEERAKREAEERAQREAAERAIANMEYVDIICPKCHEKLSFEKGTSDAQCPFCDCKIHID